MKKILAFGASNSTKSINKELAKYASTLVKDAAVKLIDLNAYEMPIYSPEREANGFPTEVDKFIADIDNSDIVLISFAEHNGNYTVAYKNILDWVSRKKYKMFEGKKMVLLATSPGARGGASVLQIATTSLPFFGAEVVGSLSLPNFNDNFANGKITNVELDNKLIDLTNKL